MSRRSAATTIVASFDERSNALNLLRLGLAVTVIVAHAWQLGGWPSRPHMGDLELGATAVGGFFAVSGFLITRSAERLPTGRFLLHRVVRIYPGFICAIVVTAVGFAPLSVVVFGEAGWDPIAALWFVVRNAGLKLVTVDIAGTLDRVPFPASWNGVMWTLAYEFCCYILAGVLALLSPRRRLTSSMMLLTVLFVVELAERLGLVVVPHGLQIGLWPAACFMAGSLLYMVRSRVPATAGLTVGAVAVAGIAICTGTAALFLPLPFAYLLILAATRLPGRRIGSKNDVSYGMYLYGWPVGQLLAHVLHAPSTPPLAIAAVTLLLTLPFAWLSWIAVERPARDQCRRALTALRRRRVPRSGA